jgi:hypothetical protein
MADELDLDAAADEGADEEPKEVDLGEDEGELAM